MKLLNQLFTIASWTHEPTLAAHIRLNPECIIYKAHFPGRPITPGVCIIGIVTELLETYYALPLQLDEVKNLKFVDVIEPTKVESLSVVFEKIELADGLMVRGTVSADEHIYTKFSFIYR